MDDNVILQAAYKELEDKGREIAQAELLIKVLREAGEDATKEASALAQLKARRNKLMIALQQNGASSV